MDFVKEAERILGGTPVRPDDSRIHWSHFPVPTGAPYWMFKFPTFPPARERTAGTFICKKCNSIGLKLQELYREANIDHQYWCLHCGPQQEMIVSDACGPLGRQMSKDAK